MKIDLPGTEFRAVFIPKGVMCENYPTKDDKHDIIEFYDRDFTHTPDGQFTGGRYRVETLLERQDEQPCGLCLYGGIAKWRLSAQSMTTVLDWLKQCVSNVEVTRG